MSTPTHFAGLWSCPKCGEYQLPQVAKCRHCGIAKPVYGLKPDAPAPKPALKPDRPRRPAVRRPGGKYAGRKVGEFCTSQMPEEGAPR